MNWTRERALKASWEWHAFVGQLPAEPVPLPAAGASGLLASGRCVYRGVTGTNTSTGGGSMQFLNGQDSKGGLVQYVGVGGSSSFGPPYLVQGVLCDIGLFVVNSGIVVTAAAWVVHLWKYESELPDF